MRTHSMCCIFDVSVRAKKTDRPIQEKTTTTTREPNEQERRRSVLKLSGLLLVSFSTHRHLYEVWGIVASKWEIEIFASDIAFISGFFFLFFLILASILRNWLQSALWVICYLFYEQMIHIVHIKNELALFTLCFLFHVSVNSEVRRLLCCHDTGLRCTVKHGRKVNIRIELKWWHSVFFYSLLIYINK